MKYTYHNGLKGLAMYLDHKGQPHIEPRWSGPLGFLAWVNGRVMVALGLQKGNRSRPHRKVIIRS